ncbi:hypothetical protein [Nostoc sp.]|uniref:hypothetical protein n=1 Tax=Nostoc sp. TaxID=1180 RepID=UPI002FFCAE21
MGMRGAASDRSTHSPNNSPLLHELTRKIQNLFHPNHLQSLVIPKYFLSQQTLPKVVVVPR